MGAFLRGNAARGGAVPWRPSAQRNRHKFEFSLVVRRGDGVASSIAAARLRLHRHPSLYFILYPCSFVCATEIARAPCTDRLRVSSRDAKPWRLLHPLLPPHPQAGRSNVQVSIRRTLVLLPRG